MHSQPHANSRSQPTSRVGNLKRRRRDDITDAGLGSGRSRRATQQSKTGSSTSTLSNQPSPHDNLSPQEAPRALGRPPKRPRRSTIQTTAYSEPDIEQDAQVDPETIHLSDGTSDEYQKSDGSDETELDTEPDAGDDAAPDSTIPRPPHRSRAADQPRNNRVTSVRISTTAGSQEVPPRRGEPGLYRRIIRGAPYTPPTFSSSSAARYSSPLATHSPTTSGARSSSPAVESSTPRRQQIWPDIVSRRNTASGAEAAIVARAKVLILRYTLFVDPLPGVVALTSEVHRVWLQALEEISDAGQIEPSEENIKVIRQRHSGVRSQFVYHVKREIVKLYNLPEGDPTALARKVDYLLEEDRFMCAPRGYEEITFRFLAPQIADAIWGKYFEGTKMRGIVEPDFLGRINGTMICLTCAILCHTLRAWQSGGYKDPGDFKPETVGDLLARQKATWANCPGWVQQMILEKTQGTIKARVENVHGTREDRREGFTDNWAAVAAELRGQTSSQAPRRPTPRRQTPGGLHIGTLVRRQDSQNTSQETNLSFDFPQMSAVRVLSFLDSDPPSPNGLREATEGPAEDSAPSPTLSQRLSLNFENVGEGGAGILESVSAP